jgi:hypothetical protein
MKTFVHFDSVGGIHSVVTVDAPDEVSAMVVPEPGLSVAEVSGPELASAAGDTEKLLEIMRKYKVAMPFPSQCKLKRSKAP